MRCLGIYIINTQGKDTKIALILPAAQCSLRDLYDDKTSIIS
jgi:hypothetical protein